MVRGRSPEENDSYDVLCVNKTEFIDVMVLKGKCEYVCFQGKLDSS